MISIEILMSQVSGLSSDDIDRWIGNDWVRPDLYAGHYAFREIDVARIHLIQALRDEMQVNEAALPVVLSLLDQLYDMRRRLRELRTGLGLTVPETARRALAAYLYDDGPADDIAV
jgi:chaperone modulatory protein CbpM